MSKENEPMEIKFFTTTGADIWKLEQIKTFIALRNLETGGTVTVEKDDKEYIPVFMPINEKQKAAEPKQTAVKIKKKTKKKPTECLKKYARKKQTGIINTDSGRFQAGFWDGAKKKNVNLGTYDTLEEALAERAKAKAKAKAKSSEQDRGERTFAAADKPISEQESKNVSVIGGGNQGDWKGA